MATTFITTAAGLALEADSIANDTQIRPSYIEFGEGKYNADGSETALTMPFLPRKVYRISATSAENGRASMRAIVGDVSGFNAFEMGIYVNGEFNANGELISDGVLYAIAAHSDAQGAILTKLANEIVIFQSAINYSNQPNFQEGPVLLAAIATEDIAGIARRSSPAQAQDGRDNETFLSPLRGRQLIESIVKGLPTVSAADNGKLLSVAAGAWAAVAGVSADAITSGVLTIARIPNLTAEMITGGILNAARLPRSDSAAVNAGTTTTSVVTPQALTGSRYPKVFAYSSRPTSPPNGAASGDLIVWTE